MASAVWPICAAGCGGHPHSQPASPSGVLPLRVLRDAGVLGVIHLRVSKVRAPAPTPAAPVCIPDDDTTTTTRDSKTASRAIARPVPRARRVGEGHGGAQDCQIYEMHVEIHENTAWPGSISNTPKICPKYQGTTWAIHPNQTGLTHRRPVATKARRHKGPSSQRPAITEACRYKRPCP